MEHQLRHSSLLYIAADAGQRIGHMRPVIDGGEVHVAERHGAVRASVRVVPVFHQLRRGGGHTSRQGVLAADQGAAVVVAIPLIPLRGEQRRHRSGKVAKSDVKQHIGHLMVVGQRRPAGVDGARYLVLVALKPPPQLRIERVGSGRIKAVRQDGLGTVVGRHHHIAATAAVDEKVDMRKTHILLDKCSFHLVTSRYRLPELPGESLRLVHFHRTGVESSRHQCTEKHRNQFFHTFHSAIFFCILLSISIL